LIDHLPFGDREFGCGGGYSSESAHQHGSRVKGLVPSRAKEMTSDAQLDNQPDSVSQAFFSGQIANGIDKVASGSEQVTCVQSV
jgi:hypothetical protein